MLLQGCTRYHAYEAGKSDDLVCEINEKAENNYADITLRNRDKFLIKDLLITQDSTYFYHVDAEREMNISNYDINNILIVDRPKGALKGFAIGAIFGLLYGIYAIKLLEDLRFEDSSVHINGSDALAIAASGALIGGLIFGVPVGWIRGVRDNYEIKQPDPIRKDLKP